MKSKKMSALLVLFPLLSFSTATEANVRVLAIRKNGLDVPTSEANSSWETQTIASQELHFIVSPAGTSGKYGYYSGQLNVTKFIIKGAQASDSFLVLATVDSWFVPGIVACKSNQTYDGGQHNNSGTVEIDCSAPSGYQIAYKKATPQNEAVETTITTSFGTSLTFGTVQATGISLSDIELDASRNYGLGLNYDYTTTYTDEQPSLTAQPSPTSNCDFSWIYSFDNFNRAKDVSFHASIASYSKCRGQTQAK